jgi:SAM-dependent methyltransferase
MTSFAGQNSCQVCHSSNLEHFCHVFDRVLQRPEKTWEVRRCKDCGFGWTAPPLDENLIAGYYPPVYLGNTSQALDEFFSGQLTRSRSWRKETEKRHLVERFTAGGKILDVGAGDGRFLWALDQEKWERTGVESAREVVELVRSNMPRLNLVAGDIYSDQLAPGKFDVVTFWHVLEHLPGPRRVLARAASLLRPGGWIFISLPNLQSFQARLFRRHWYAFDDVPRHLYHFSPQALERLLQEQGLQIRARLFFSRLVNFHCLKHSLINWSKERYGSRIPYYLLKPLLLGFPIVEKLSGKYGMLTVVARKSP